VSKNETINDPAIAAITALAEKLGVATEYLWAALLRQAPISGVVSLLMMTFFIAIAVHVNFLVHKNTRVIPNKYGDPNQNWDDTMWFLVVGVWVLVALIVWLSLDSALSAFFNPAYWALMKIKG
jgi:hypothetical protein